MAKHKNVVTQSRRSMLVSLFVFVFGLAMFASFAAPQKAEAITRADAVRQCRLKATAAKETQCLNKVNACQPQNTNACLNAALSTTGPLVHSGCRTADNPQGCNQTVEKNCGPPTPDRERPECKKLEARKANNNSARGSNPGQANSPDAVDEKFEGLKPVTAETFTNTCGQGEDAIKTRFNFGCQGKGNPIVDLAYAIIRFLSYGVGLVLAASIIYAGIMYSTSSGNAENSQAAKERIINAFVALIFYLFIFAFVQYLVPGGLFN